MAVFEVMFENDALASTGLAGVAGMGELDGWSISCAVSSCITVFVREASGG